MPILRIGPYTEAIEWNRLAACDTETGWTRGGKEVQNGSAVPEWTLRFSHGGRAQTPYVALASAHVGFIIARTIPLEAFEIRQVLDRTGCKPVPRERLQIQSFICTGDADCPKKITGGRRISSRPQNTRSHVDDATSRMRKYPTRASASSRYRQALPAEDVFGIRQFQTCRASHPHR